MLRYLNGYLLYPLLEKATKREIFSKYKDLKLFEKLSIKEKNHVQKEELYKMLSFCSSEIPYYRDLFKKEGFDIEKCRQDIKYLQELPVLTKDIVREKESFLKYKKPKHKRKTGGSTGQSVNFFYDDEGLDWTAAINLMAYRFAGNTLHKKDAHISSELGIGPTSIKSKFIDFMKLGCQNRKRIMINSFSDKDLENTFKSLKRWRPYLLQGHPSTAYALANYIHRHDLKGTKYCSVFEPSGEMLTPKMVEIIEMNIGCKVVNRYGNAEFGVMAHSRLSDSFNRLEVFNRGFIMEECENSNLIVTGLTNYGMPLLRYDTGDIGTVKIEEKGTFLYDIHGRIHDNVDISGQNYATHYIMDYLDHKVKNVREFQVVIKDDIPPILKIVLEKEDQKKRVYSELKERWPQGIYIEFIDFDDLETVGWRQKFRHVIDKRKNAS